MITVLIGHRGVGKTSFLKRIQNAFDQQVETVDLDLLIKEHFDEIGETEYRKKEHAAFLEAIKNRNKKTFIALGAGFNFEISSGIEIIWIRRETDRWGRIFLDRPRLEPQLSPLEEYAVRFRQRDDRFRRLAHRQYILREGSFDELKADRAFFKIDQEPMNGSLTVLPWMLQTLENEKTARYLELRDDLLDKSQISQALTLDKLFLMTHKKSPDFEESKAVHDWPLEKFKNSSGVVSLHQRSHDLNKDFKRLENFERVKFAPMIESFEELELCHQWWKQKPDQRSFLPCSEDGRWSWYRALFGPKMEIGFFRYDEGASPDQPTFAEWFYSRNFENHFAAVLGDPIEHSWSPSYHTNFFAGFKMPMVKIKISKASDLKILKSMGLVAAAITSPFKKLFRAEAANTVCWDFVEHKWQWTNTDKEGLKVALETFQEIKNWAVWGGGGLIETFKDQLPEAQYYGARNGQLKSGKQKEFDGLIWACGRGTPFQFPVKRPQLILDLNYTENSPGLEFALRTGAKYFSGATFFKAQAQAQQKFFEAYLQKRPRMITTL